ncbi:MAG TPA: DUF3151 family protein, partial [Acidimicrobiales bacterium]|nr:DUF3151 family protein [Acidimicrobiales bacterium]
MPDGSGEGPSRVRLSGGLPETVLPAEPDEVRRDLTAALTGPEEQRRAAIGAVARRAPRSLAAWEALGRLVEREDDLAAYAYFRVGYHRGLDALRAAGWR